MARQVELTEEEFRQLSAELSGGKLEGDGKVLAQILIDRAQQARMAQSLDDPGWYFSWTYRF
jgi:hypothetical protein